MAWPGDGVTQGLTGRGELRASHADREQAVGALKAAFVAGMLAKDEFDQRVSQGLASRTYAELADLTADLPAGLEEGLPPSSARAGGGQPLVRPGQIITGASLLYVGAWLYVPSRAAPALAVLGGFFYLCVLAIAVAVAFENRDDERSGKQPPRRHTRDADRLVSDSVTVAPGVEVRYETPGPAVYVSLCRPAFSPARLRRESGT
jgi:hypothetical protein